MAGITQADLDWFAKEQGLPRQTLFDWLSRQDELLLANLKVLFELSQILQARKPATPGTITVIGGPSVSAIGIRTVPIIADSKARSTEVVYPTALANCFGALRVVVVMKNMLDQDVTYAIIGNVSESPSDAFTIASGTITTKTSEIYQLAFEEWMPYIGAQITPSVTPTAGGLDVFVVIQEWG